MYGVVNRLYDYPIEGEAIGIKNFGFMINGKVYPEDDVQIFVSQDEYLDQCEAEYDEMLKYYYG